MIHAVELPRLLHIGMVSRPSKNHLSCASNAQLQRVGNLKNLWRILVAHHDQGWYVDFRKPVDSGRFERKHVLLVCHEVAVPLDVLG